MKIATGNRINEFWQELKGVLVPKEKVLKTIEEIEANTNEENIAGATALKAVNNKLMFPDGTAFYLDTKEGERGFNTDPQRGADTFFPFRKKNSLKLLSHWGKSHNASTATHTYTLSDDLSTLLIEYIVTLGDAASNLPTVTVDGVKKTGFSYRSIAVTSPSACMIYTLTLTDLKKNNTLVMTSPYWGTNSYELQLWGC